MSAKSEKPLAQLDPLVIPVGIDSQEKERLQKERKKVQNMYAARRRRDKVTQEKELKTTLTKELEDHCITLLKNNLMKYPDISREDRHNPVLKDKILSRMLDDRQSHATSETLPEEL